MLRTTFSKPLKADDFTFGFFFKKTNSFINHFFFITGIPLRRLISKYGSIILVLIKALLLGKRVLVCSGKDTSLLVSSVVVTIASLLPRELQKMSAQENIEEQRKTLTLSEEELRSNNSMLLCCFFSFFLFY